MGQSSDDPIPQQRRGRLLKALHIVGYVTTAIVLIELVFIAYLATGDWLERRALDARLIEESRTHEGPLRPTDDRLVRGSALRQLALLPPLRALHGDGLRFTVMPSFSGWYAIAIAKPQGAAQGVLYFTRNSEQGIMTQSRRFAMPGDAYSTLMSRFDRLTDGWPGEANLCLDGSPTAFERVRGSRVTSGIANCNSRYDELRQLMLQVMRRFAPGSDLPTEDDWHRESRNEMMPLELGTSLN